MRGQPPLPLDAGTIVDVTGVSAQGGYAALVARPTVRIVGKGSLPEAPRVSLDRLLTGIDDCQWVELEGIVHSVVATDHLTAYAGQGASNKGNALMTLATGAGLLDVITFLDERVDYASLIDAKVLVRGVCGPRFNQRKQLIGIHLFAQSLVNVQVLEPAPRDPFALPLCPIDGAMRYVADVTPGHRLHVRGVVTAAWGGRLVAIADGSHGLLMRTNGQSNDVRVGDDLDVVGFPAMGEYTPVLQDVVYARVGSAEPAPPKPTTIAEALKGAHDAELVRVSGRLLNQNRTANELNLLMTGDGGAFVAALPADQDASALASLPDGSQLELVGLCYVEVYPDKTPKAVRILLRSPDDVVVLARPSWWTTSRLLKNSKTGLWRPKMLCSIKQRPQPIACRPGSE
jgi:hypothetical protein